jgi:hypothetical protein
MSAEPAKHLALLIENKTRHCVCTVSFPFSMGLGKVSALPCRVRLP